MTSPDHLLSVTTSPGGDIVTIHGDLAGIMSLRDSLNTLLTRLSQGECDHKHFRSPDWAGFELSTSMLTAEQQAGHITVHHLEVLAWSPEWKVKHGL